MHAQSATHTSLKIMFERACRTGEGGGGEIRKFQQVGIFSLEVGIHEIPVCAGGREGGAFQHS